MVRPTLAVVAATIPSAVPFGVCQLPRQLTVDVPAVAHSVCNCHMDQLTPELQRKLQVEELWTCRNALADSINAERRQRFHAQYASSVQFGAPSGGASFSEEQHVKNIHSHVRGAELHLNVICSGIDDLLT